MRQNREIMLSIYTPKVPRWWVQTRSACQHSHRTLGVLHKDIIKNSAYAKSTLD